jgi:hypothetical protein
MEDWDEDEGEVSVVDDARGFDMSMFADLQQEIATESGEHLAILDENDLFQFNSSAISLVRAIEGPLWVLGVVNMNLGDDESDRGSMGGEEDDDNSLDGTEDDGVWLYQANSGGRSFIILEIKDSRARERAPGDLNFSLREQKQMLFLLLAASTLLHCSSDLSGQNMNSFLLLGILAENTHVVLDGSLEGREYEHHNRRTSSTSRLEESASAPGTPLAHFMPELIWMTTSENPLPLGPGDGTVNAKKNGSSASGELRGRKSSLAKGANGVASRNLLEDALVLSKAMDTGTAYQNQARMLVAQHFARRAHVELPRSPAPAASAAAHRNGAGRAGSPNAPKPTALQQELITLQEGGVSTVRAGLSLEQLQDLFGLQEEEGGDPLGASSLGGATPVGKEGTTPGTTPAARWVTPKQLFGCQLSGTMLAEMLLCIAEMLDEGGNGDDDSDDDSDEDGSDDDDSADGGKKKAGSRNGRAKGEGSGACEKTRVSMSSCWYKAVSAQCTKAAAIAEREYRAHLSEAVRQQMQAVTVAEVGEARVGSGDDADDYDEDDEDAVRAMQQAQAGSSAPEYTPVHENVLGQIHRHCLHRSRLLFRAICDTAVLQFHTMGIQRDGRQQQHQQQLQQIVDEGSGAVAAEVEGLRNHTHELVHRRETSLVVRLQRWYEQQLLPSNRRAEISFSEDMAMVLWAEEGREEEEDSAEDREGGTAEVGTGYPGHGLRMGGVELGNSELALALASPSRPLALMDAHGAPAMLASVMVSHRNRIHRFAHTFHNYMVAPHITHTHTSSHQAVGGDADADALGNGGVVKSNAVSVQGAEGGEEQVRLSLLSACRGRVLVDFLLSGAGSAAADSYAAADSAGADSYAASPLGRAMALAQAGCECHRQAMAQGHARLQAQRQLTRQERARRDAEVAGREQEAEEAAAQYLERRTASEGKRRELQARLDSQRAELGKERGRYAELEERVLQRQEQVQNMVKETEVRHSIRPLEGYLLKKGSGTSTLGRRNWKERYFALDIAQARLIYATNYDSYAKGKFLKEVVVSGCQIMRGSSSAKAKRKSAGGVSADTDFEIHPPQAPGEGEEEGDSSTHVFARKGKSKQGATKRSEQKKHKERVFRLRASSAEVCENWIERLTAAAGTTGGGAGAEGGGWGDDGDDDNGD